MDVAQVLAVVIGLTGLAGVIFTALRFRRSDTGELVAQQDYLFNELKVLNEELRIQVDRLRDERDELQRLVENLRGLRDG